MYTHPTTTADIPYKAVGDYFLPMIALPEASAGSERPFCRNTGR